MITVNENIDSTFFEKAQPIWLKELEYEQNMTAGFRVVIDGCENKNVILRIAASTVYRFFVNGKFVGHGPAVGPHGFYRVDEWNLDQAMKAGHNIIAIEVVGYNINSFYRLDQPSFLQAEVLVDNKVESATGVPLYNFEAGILNERIQKVQRYSFQRTFIEAYKLTPSYDSWRYDTSIALNAAPVEIMPEKKLLQRRVKYPQFELRTPEKHVSKGKIKTGVKPENYWQDRSFTDIGPELKGFKIEELEVLHSDEMQEIEPLTCERIDAEYHSGSAITLEEKTYHILDLGINLTGFIGAQITCTKDTRLSIVFDEILSEDDVDFKRLYCINIINFDMPAGEYNIETFEPYTLKFMKFVVLKGECRIDNIYLREYVNPDVSRAEFEASDDRLNQIFDAGLETFKQNVVDVFMDCPSRERAGWLCDSYFTSRVAFDLSGNTLIETNFFENFLLPEKYPHIPDGMLPMCYPSDHYHKSFIPNWAMWFVIELEEYLQRSADFDMAERLKSKVFDLLKYFDKFKNEDGLLENLESWIFVEWSMANKLVQDVNYPTNMLYAATLSAAGRIYKTPQLIEEGNKISNTIREQSFNGEFFIDNAVRENGKLVSSNIATEVCQYYAFFFDIATPERYPDLWNKLVNDFGPKRKVNNKYPKVHMANAFIGNYLRLEILSRVGLVEQMLQESVGYFTYMAERTGTLWEHDATTASCNHGFGSHVIHSYYRDILGAYEINIHEKRVKLRFCEMSMKKCKGTIPAGDEIITIEWTRDDSQINCKVEVPKGFEVDMENRCSQEVNLSLLKR